MHCTKFGKTHSFGMLLSMFIGRYGIAPVLMIALSLDIIHDCRRTENIQYIMTSLFICLWKTFIHFMWRFSPPHPQFLLFVPPLHIHFQSHLLLPKDSPVAKWTVFWWSKLFLFFLLYGNKVMHEGSAVVSGSPSSAMASPLFGNFTL